MKSYIFISILAVCLILFYVRTSYKIHKKINQDGSGVQPTETLTQSLVRFLSDPFSSNGTESVGQERRRSVNSGQNYEDTTGRTEELRKVLSEFLQELKSLEEKFPSSEAELEKVFQSSVLKQEISFYQTEIQKIRQLFQKEQEQEKNKNSELFSTVFNQRITAKKKYWHPKQNDPREESLIQVIENYKKKISRTNADQKTKVLKCTSSLYWDQIAQSSVSCLLFGILSERKIVLDFNGVKAEKTKSRYPSMQTAFSSEEELFRYFSAQFGTEKLPVSSPKPLSAKEIMCWPTPFNQIDDTVISIESSDYYGSAILANTQYQEFYDSLPPNYFQVLFEFLWKAKEGLESQVEFFVASEFSVFVVGMELFEYYNPKTEKIFLPPPSLFALQADELSYYQTFVPYSQVKWYLRTNSEEVEQKLLQDFPDKIFTLKAPSLSPLEKELVEWLAFGYTDDQIITEPSTFGDTATARMGLKPALCNFAKYCTRRIFPVPNTLSPTLQEQPLTCLKNTSYKYASAQDAGSYFWKNIFATKPVIF